MSLSDWQRLLTALPVASSHSHHQVAQVHAGLDLDQLLSNSYIGWGTPGPVTPEQREPFLESVATNTYFLWLSRAVADIYAEGEITADNWDRLSSAIQTSHSDPEHHFRLLTDVCRLKFAVQDAYWDPGDDLGRRELLRPTYRINPWAMGHGPGAQDHNGNSPWKTEGFAPATLDEYLALCEQAVREKLQAGCVALKSALAYDRTQAYDNPDLALARRAFGKPPGEATEAEKLAFGDVVMHRLCALAGELSVPLQVHLGLGILSGSRPMLFEPMIARYRQTTFDLFHCGYPWCHEVGGLLHNYPNAYADFCWLPLISTTAAVRALHEYLDVAFDSARILWGDDAWTAEEAYGARLAWEHVVARVLHERVQAGLLGRPAAEKLAEKLMYGNVEALYGSGGA